MTIDPISPTINSNGMSTAASAIYDVMQTRSRNRASKTPSKTLFSDFFQPAVLHRSHREDRLVLSREAREYIETGIPPSKSTPVVYSQYFKQNT